MAHPYHHAVRSAQLFGGIAADYQAIHDWFDESKAHLADVRHRALRHHTEGIFLCEKLFGTTITNAVGKPIPVRFIGEQHVKDDLGWIPTVKDWLEHLTIQPWMQRSPFRPTTSTLTSTPIDTVPHLLVTGDPLNDTNTPNRNSGHDAAQ